MTRPALIFPPIFMLIELGEQHPCMQSGELKVSGKDVATLRRWKKSLQILVSVFRPTCLVFGLYLIGR